MQRISDTIALGTSGLGPFYGGIGTVAKMMANALRSAGPVAIWRHYPDSPPVLRRPAWVLRLLLGGLSRPCCVLYDHVGLAAGHLITPSLKGVPFAIFLHGTEIWRPLSGPKKKALTKAGLLISNSVFTSSRAMEVHPWMPEIRPVMLGVPRQKAPTIPMKDRPPMALMVGRMHPAERYKGHDQVLEAWPMIHARVPGIRLIILGAGEDMPRLKAKASALKSVEFRGLVSEAERDTLYRNARLLLSPSLKEGFGLNAAEAGAAGTPTLGLRGTVIEELFPGERGVVLTEAQTPEAIAEAAIPFLSDLNLATRAGEAARTRVESFLLEEHFQQRFLAAIQGLVQNKL